MSVCHDSMERSTKVKLETVKLCDCDLEHADQYFITFGI